MCEYYYFIKLYWRFSSATSSSALKFFSISIKIFTFYTIASLILYLYN